MLTNEPKKSSHMFGTTRENILPNTICCCAKWKIPGKKSITHTAAQLSNGQR